MTDPHFRLGPWAVPAGGAAPIAAPRENATRREPAFDPGSRTDPRRHAIARNAQSGFALLLIFLLAGCMAIMMYMAVPRAAFEHQREKEALLVDRGEQYKRAIEMHVRRLSRLPQSLDDLEQSTPNMRYLRHRFPDPMTGKDEWRLVHTDAAGQYMDSKVFSGATGQGPGINASDLAASSSSSSGSTSDAASANTGPPGSLAPGLQARSSDHLPPLPSMNGAGGNSEGDSGGSSSGGDSGASPGASFGLNPGAAVHNDSQSDPFTFNSSAQSALAFQPGQTPGDGQNQDSTSTMDLAMALALRQPCFIGAGVVGVASTVDQVGIRIYRQHSNYSEWEFLYERRNPQGIPLPCMGNAPGNYRGAPGVSLGGMNGGGVAAPGGSTLGSHAF